MRKRGGSWDSSLVPPKDIPTGDYEKIDRGLVPGLRREPRSGRAGGPVPGRERDGARRLDRPAGDRDDPQPRGRARRDRADHRAAGRRPRQAHRHPAPRRRRPGSASRRSSGRPRSCSSGSSRAAPSRMRRPSTTAFPPELREQVDILPVDSRDEFGRVTGRQFMRGAEVGAGHGTRPQDGARAEGAARRADDRVLADSGGRAEVRGPDLRERQAASSRSSSTTRSSRRR